MVSLVKRLASRQFWAELRFDLLDDVITDVRYGIRSLTRSPGFTLAVIGVLSLGVGLNVAVFTLLKALMFSPIAGVERSGQLAVIVGEASGGRSLYVSYVDYQALRDNVRAFAELCGIAPIYGRLGVGSGTRNAWGELVTGNYFRVLGVRAQLGRTLAPSDEVTPGGHPVVVISDGLWRRDFAADPDILGRTIVVNGYPLIVVGVTDPAFHGTLFSFESELFVPVMMARQMGIGRASGSDRQLDPLTARSLSLIVPHGYLRPGATLAAANTQAAATWSALMRDRRFGVVIQRLTVLPFWRSPMGAQRYMAPLFTVLSVMGLLVLGVTCTNLSGLLLARGASRRGDIAVRLALGATRLRNVRLLTIECLLLALPGAVLGVLLGWRCLAPLTAALDRAAAPQRLFFNFKMDAVVIAFAIVVACLGALMSGFVPALRTSRIRLASVMKEEMAPGGATKGILRAGLVVGQVAVAVVLLVGAGLATRSLLSAQRADRGFDERQVTSVVIDPGASGYDEERGRVYYRRLLDSARAAPGITSATLAQFTPLTSIEPRSLRLVLKEYSARRGEDLSFLSNIVGPDYFKTLGIDLLAGRAFNDSDNETAAPVAIVNRTMAQRFWGGANNAIGKQLRVINGEWRTIIGVAADIKYVQIDEAPRGYLYLPVLQTYSPTMILHTRGPAPVDALVSQARTIVGTLDANVPILEAQPLTHAVSGALLLFRWLAAALALFGMSGMGLAALGTYTLVAYMVKQSTREIGIRSALGASSFTVARSFLVRGLRLGAIGSVIGIVTALVSSVFLRRVLYGVSAADFFSFALALAVVLGAVCAASLVPAWRAARINPLRALRYE